MLLLTTEEFAFFVDKTPNAVHLAQLSGRLKSVKVGKLRLIPATELEFYHECNASRKPLYL